MRKRKGKETLTIKLDEQGRPDKIVCDSTEEFMAVIARDKAGEFKVTILEVGSSNGQWIFHVSHPQPKQSHMFE